MLGQMLWEQVREKLLSDVRLEDEAKAHSDKALALVNPPPSPHFLPCNGGGADEGGRGQGLARLHGLKEELVTVRGTGLAVSRALAAAHDTLHAVRPPSSPPPPALSRHLALRACMVAGLPVG